MSSPAPYMELLASLAPLDRCHAGPEMTLAYERLAAQYPGARLVRVEPGTEIAHWRLPPAWLCTVAELTDSDGRVIASKARNPLEVFSYSPAVDEWLTLDELQPHLLSDVGRPDAVLFHFRNQYRHWAPEWGFSIPHRVRETLRPGAKYHARIESRFEPAPLVQSDYAHQGRRNETFLFVGHFDHPAQVNDGLAGCIAAYEVIRRLQGRSTTYSYRAFASVEIVGSVAYLANEPEVAEATQEALFLGFAGIDAPLVYQQSFHRRSRLDRIVKFLLGFEDAGRTTLFQHRELVGNDENVFDSVGYEIPTGTLTRWPFPDYHTDRDSLAVTSEASIEDVIDHVMRIIDVLENDRYLSASFRGLPSLANPDVNLYLSFDNISGVSGAASAEAGRFDSVLSAGDKAYLRAHPNLLNRLMQNMLRMADGAHTVFDVAERSRVPFALAHAYARSLEQKSLVVMREEQA